MTVGIITHLRNASIAETRALVSAAEEAGADWVGIPDAFWWRDTWVLLAEAARATKRIQIGPLVTNPYTRHPFQTIAALATIQDLAGPRVFLGLGAGGSEVTGAAGLSRADAAPRIVELVATVRRVAAGGALDPGSGRTLEVPLADPPILVAGRAGAVLEAAGRVADRVLLWAVPSSELDRSVGRVEAGTIDREPNLAAPRPERIWAPLVAHDPTTLEHIRRTAAYATLNSRPARQAAWGLTPDQVTEIRRALVAGGAANAASLVPEAALADLIVTDTDIAPVAAEAARLGVTSLALPAFDIATVGDRVGWARAVVDTAATAVARRVSSESAA